MIPLFHIIWTQGIQFLNYIRGSRSSSRSNVDAKVIFGKILNSKFIFWPKLPFRPRMMCDTTFPHNLDARNPILKLHLWFKVIFKVKCWCQGHFGQNIDLKFPIWDKVSIRARMMYDTNFPHYLDINNLIIKLFVGFKVTFKVHKSMMAANQVGTFFLKANARIVCKETFLQYLDARNLVILWIQDQVQCHKLSSNQCDPK